MKQGNSAGLNRRSELSLEIKIRPKHRFTVRSFPCSSTSVPDHLQSMHASNNTVFSNQHFPRRLRTHAARGDRRKVTPLAKVPYSLLQYGRRSWNGLQEKYLNERNIRSFRRFDDRTLNACVFPISLSLSLSRSVVKINWLVRLLRVRSVGTACPDFSGNDSWPFQCAAVSSNYCQ